MLDPPHIYEYLYLVNFLSPSLIMSSQYIVIKFDLNPRISALYTKINTIPTREEWAYSIQDPESAFQLVFIGMVEGRGGYPGRNTSWRHPSPARHPTNNQHLPLAPYLYTLHYYILLHISLLFYEIQYLANMRSSNISCGANPKPANEDIIFANK